MRSVKSISSSQSYLMLRGQIEKIKPEVFGQQALFEKLQVVNWSVVALMPESIIYYVVLLFDANAFSRQLQIEKDNIIWREKELNIKNNILDILRRSSTVSDTRINDLEMLIQKQKDEKKSIENKLAEALKEPGWVGFSAFLRS